MNLSDQIKNKRCYDDDDDDEDDNDDGDGKDDDDDVNVQNLLRNDYILSQTNQFSNVALSVFVLNEFYCICNISAFRLSAIHIRLCGLRA